MPTTVNAVGNALTGVTGTGTFVGSNSPTLVTPALGTPASGTLTNAIGLPIVGGTTGTLSVARGGTGVTTSTGTGNTVLSNSPTLVTPALGTPASGVLDNCTNAASWPFRNIITDNGRFNTSGNGFNVLLGAGTFSAGTFIGAYNGSTRADGGRFYHDNSTSGGAGSAINSNVQSLLSALGRTGFSARYGTEFHILELTAGAGTAAPATFPSGTLYLMSANNGSAFIVSGSRASFNGWFRVTAGTAGIILGAGSTINGTTQTGNINFNSASGWVHIRNVVANSLGYSSSFPNIYGTSGTVVQLALIGVYTGQVSVGIHLAPLCSNGDV